MATVDEKTALARAKVQRALVRRDRAIKKYWDLLGWGTSEEIEKASKAVTAASQSLALAEASLARIEKLK